MMKMTIENDNLVYIYLLNRNKKTGIVEETYTDIDGHLIYDTRGNWIGLSIDLRATEDADISKYDFVDAFDCRVYIEKNKEQVLIRFDSGESEIGEQREQHFNLDIVENKVFGIEIIALDTNDLSKRNIPEEMLAHVE